MRRDRPGVMWAGPGLLGLGMAFLLAQWIGWDKIWPLLIVLLGLIGLIGGQFRGFRRE